MFCCLLVCGPRNLVSLLVQTERLCMWLAGNVPADSLSFLSIRHLWPTPTHTHTRAHEFTVMFVCFPSGTYQDCEEASGDGLVVSGNRSAGAGAGEKCGVCVCVCGKQILVHVQQNLRLLVFGQVRTMTSKHRLVPNNQSEMPENVSQIPPSREPQSGLFRMKMYYRPTTRNDPKMQGFMGIRRPVLACDSLLFFMLGKPSITTLTQSKPQSGPMLIFSCFSCVFFELVRAAERPNYRKRHRRVKHA